MQQNLCYMYQHCQQWQRQQQQRLYQHYGNSIRYVYLLGLHCTILCRVCWIARESASVNSVIRERGQKFFSRARVLQPPAGAVSEYHWSQLIELLLFQRIFFDVTILFIVYSLNTLTSRLYQLQPIYFKVSLTAQ